MTGVVTMSVDKFEERFPGALTRVATRGSDAYIRMLKNTTEAGKPLISTYTDEYVCSRCGEFWDFAVYMDACKFALMKEGTCYKCGCSSEAILVPGLFEAARVMTLMIE